MEGLQNEEGGEERKIRGEEMVLLLCQGMPLTEIEGYCFCVHELFWPWGLIDDGAAMVMNILASLLLKTVYCHEKRGCMLSGLPFCC